MKFDLKKFVAVVSQVGPVVLAMVPGGDKIAPVIPKIVDGIKEAEAMKGASGADKKRHVLNIVEQAVGVANTTGKVSISADQVKSIASQGIDAVVATVHVIEGAKVTKGATAAGAVGAIPGGVPNTSPAAAGVEGAGTSILGVDTHTRASDLGDGRATHGHGSSDNLPPAPPVPANANAADTDADGDVDAADRATADERRENLPPAGASSSSSSSSSSSGGENR